MSDQTLIDHGAPTLAGIKTGSLFSVRIEERSVFLNELKNYNKRLRAKGVCLIPLHYDNGRVLLYLYRPNRLKNDLCNKEVQDMLREKGYDCESMGKCICELKKRLNDTENFPHEIGLFLSYPPEDVKGFIENSARNCKSVGTWKVYGDKENAERTFARYKRCTETFKECSSRGISLDRLLVAI
jgi:hypothetical protein